MTNTGSMRPLEPLPRGELGRVLPYLLAPPEGCRAVNTRQLESFTEYLSAGAFEWVGLRCGSAGTPSGVFLAVLQPGATAIVMIPSPGVDGIDPHDELRVTSAGLEALRERRLHYAQALLEPEAEARRELLLAVGFVSLAPLVYLERDACFPWVDPPPRDHVEWIAYSPATHAEFAEVVQATYEGSRDCPELTDLRPIEDILAAHRASGPWEPGLWEIARIDGTCAGCILMARVAGGAALEVVYMGVVPGQRRRGVGALLLQRVLERSRLVGARQVTVVVDGRNAPARRLYARFAFEPVVQRDAYLYRWR